MQTRRGTIVVLCCFAAQLLVMMALVTAEKSGGEELAASGSSRRLLSYVAGSSRQSNGCKAEAEYLSERWKGFCRIFSGPRCTGYYRVYTVNQYYLDRPEIGPYLQRQDDLGDVFFDDKVQSAACASDVVAYLYENPGTVYSDVVASDFSLNWALVNDYEDDFGSFWFANKASAIQLFRHGQTPRCSELRNPCSDRLLRKECCN